MPEIVLWGGTGHAKVLHEAFWGTNVRLVAVFDNRPIDSPVAGVPLLVGEHAFERFVSRYSERSSLLFAVAIGGTKGRDRLHLFSYMTAHGLTPLTVKHRTAFVAVDTQIADGSQILAMSAVCARTRLGQAVIVNTSASIDHDCDVGDGVHVAPGARLAGDIRVGARAFIGTGAVVLPHLEIGEDAVVGAGAVVTRDVPPGATVIGNPARTINGSFL